MVLVRCKHPVWCMWCGVMVVVTWCGPLRCRREVTTVSDFEIYSGTVLELFWAPFQVRM